MIDADSTNAPWWFHGAQLMAVLCKGRRESSKAIPYRHFGGLTLVEHFWPEYRRIGRCAIDPAHEISFIGDDTRWSYSVARDQRSCLWCGECTQVLETWTETITRSAWRNRDAVV